MEDELTQPLTQQILDPRRLGRNNSGLSESDKSDVICVLHPTSLAAFRIVAHTAEHAPQHVLQSHGLLSEDDLEEAETFILDKPGEAQDLALRYSSRVKKPYLQFCFGRNQNFSDITMQVGPDSSKRVSNTHFRIFVNELGILMLEDMSTNGTMVDDKLLKSKSRDPSVPKTWMLQHSTMIHILSPKADEVIKFIVRVPSREGYEEEHMAKLNDYLERVQWAIQKEVEDAKKRGGQNPTPAFDLPVVPAHPAASNRRPMLKAHYSHGMHWNGRPDYNVVDQLGKGAFATVYKLATAMDGQLLAAKELEKKRFIKNGKMDQKLDNEMKIMKDLSHPNIVQYVDYRDEGSYLYIIMEYVPCGDLSKLLERGNLTEHAARRMACQIFSSLAYLHSKKITHRDIKPDNILIASEEPFDVKLSDFGLSKVVTNNETFLKTFCGTLLYCAPEVFPHYENHERGTKRRRRDCGKKYHSYSQSVDIWSFGAVLWYSLCGKPPFEGVMDNTGKGMFNKIMGTVLDPTPLTLAGVSEACIDLLIMMLNTDPSLRPTEHDCLRHPWLADLARELIPELAPQKSLKAIPEEDEEAEQVEAEDKFSQLSLYDKKAGYGPPEESDEEEPEEEVDVEPDDSWELRDIHQSKRIKRDLLFPRNQYREPLGSDSSPDPSQLPGPKPDHGTDTFWTPRFIPGKPRLFGEVGQSALDSSGILDERTNCALFMVDDSMSFSGPDTPKKLAHQANRSAKRTSNDSLYTPKRNNRGAAAASSLYGAESMVREMTMHSPSSPKSPEETSNEPKTPKTPEIQHQLHELPDTEMPQSPRIGQDGSSDGSHDGPEEVTPKAPASNFSRQINLTASWDTYDLPTRTAEYTSKVSDFDFTGDAKTLRSRAVSMPATNVNSSFGAGEGEEDDDSDEEEEPNDESLDATTGASPAPTDPKFRRPSARLGKLTSTKDSVFPLVLRLEVRTTSWGRNPNNTIVYPDSNDVRIPKKAFTLWYYAPNMNQDSLKDEDWTKMDSLDVLINTEASLGIWVNNTRLIAKDKDGKFFYGRLYTGDVITVFKAKGRRNECLKFVCEFFHGEAAKMRPEGEPFQVLKSA